MYFIEVRRKEFTRQRGAGAGARRRFPQSQLQTVRRAGEGHMTVTPATAAIPFPRRREL